MKKNKNMPIDKSKNNREAEAADKMAGKGREEERERGCILLTCQSTIMYIEHLSLLLDKRLKKTA